MGRQRLRPALQRERRRVSKKPSIVPVGPDPAFVMLVKTDNAGTSGTNQMTLPLTGSYTIDWGDGVVEELSGAQTHTYPAPGQYTIRITGGLTRIAFAAGGDRLKLLDIQNWGDIGWTTMANAFYGCANMTLTAQDIPDLSSVTSMSFMFASATEFNQDISGWNVANVTNMISMFNGAIAFNQNIGGWNVANVTSMSFMFASATEFNQDISGWNVANVTSMASMFGTATNFNQDIGGWNVAKVTTMSNMFNGVTNFNQNIGGWSVANVGNLGSSFMSGVTLSPANYGALLIGWAAQVLKPNLSFHGGNSKYPTDGTGNPATDAAAARAKIIADFGWTITDGGPV